jgi:hydrogenase maturation protease
MKILLIGQGNPGRSDDGIGPAIVESLLEAKVSCLEAEADYQLNVEHAVDISSANVVIFADSSTDSKEPFEFHRIGPSDEVRFTTHSVSPESVLSICEDLYGCVPEAYILAVRGYNFEMGEGLTDKAQRNLSEAVKYVTRFAKKRQASVVPD